MTDPANPVIVDEKSWFGPEGRAALMERAEETIARARALVIEHPIAATASALTFGFVVARIFRR
ncbi:MAG TPA: hypothetical protein VG755_31440 [Nannocystaceae bacterium]|nr:hypothetical protein [Nannocystaceae bacterium]